MSESEQTKNMRHIGGRTVADTYSWPVEVLKLSQRLDGLEALRCDRTARNVDEWLDQILKRLGALEARLATGPLVHEDRAKCAKCGADRPELCATCHADVMGGDEAMVKAARAFAQNMIARNGNQPFVRSNHGHSYGKFAYLMLWSDTSGTAGLEAYVVDILSDALLAFARQIEKERDGWKWQAEKLEREARAYRAELELHRAAADKDYWAWQGDGSDHLESLTCPIMIQASALRELLADRAASGQGVKVNLPDKETFEAAMGQKAATMGSFNFSYTRLGGEIMRDLIVGLNPPPGEAGKAAEARQPSQWVVDHPSPKAPLPPEEIEARASAAHEARVLVPTGGTVAAAAADANTVLDHWYADKQGDYDIQQPHWDQLVNMMEAYAEARTADRLASRAGTTGKVASNALIAQEALAIAPVLVHKLKDSPLPAAEVEWLVVKKRAETIMRLAAAAGEGEQNG